MTATTLFADFDELEKANEKAPEPSPPVFVKATDGIDLAVRVYEPPQEARGVLLLYHGGGAHSAAGYHLIGQGLSKEAQMRVYTPDLRGHGASKGPIGDAPSSTQVWEDVNSMLDHIAGLSENHSLPIFLGGHSSGGGLVVNYATWEGCQKDRIQAYLLLSPQLGYLAQVDRTDNGGSSNFCRVNILAFIANGITGWWGHNPAVQFQYPPEVIERDGVTPYNTVNMANAITPTDPQKQFQAISKPVILWVGAEDELFDASKVDEFVKKHGDTNFIESHIVEGQTHLGILVNAHKLMDKWLLPRL